MKADTGFNVVVIRIYNVCCEGAYYIDGHNGPDVPEEIYNSVFLFEAGNGKPVKREEIDMFVTDDGIKRILKEMQRLEKNGSRKDGYIKLEGEEISRLYKTIGSVNQKKLDRRYL